MATNLTYYNYTANVAAATSITLYPEGCTPGVLKWRSRIPNYPRNGQVTVTLTSSTSKNNVVRNRVVTNIPRLSSPVGTNPATGLAYTPTVLDSVTRIYEVLVPSTFPAAEVSDTFYEADYLHTYSLKEFLVDGFQASC